MRIIAEAAGMIERGHRVVLACQPGARILEHARDRGIETFAVRMGGAFDILGIRRVRALIGKQAVSIVNTHSSRDSWCAGLAARLLSGVKIIRTRHLGVPIKPGFDSRLLYHIIPDVVVTAGEALRKHVIEQTGASPESVLSIPTGIDLQVFDPSRADGDGFRAGLGLSAETPLIGTAGMLRGKKGHSYFLEAAEGVLRQIPEAKFVIVGDIAFESPIKRLLSEHIARLGIEGSVIMPGYRSDMPGVMAAMDVFVLPSLAEGVSQVVNQALAMKRPVVATNVGGLPEQIIDGVTGILVEKANSEQIRDAVLALLSNPDDARRMGENGRKLVEEKYSLEGMLDATEALYRRLLAVQA